MLVGLEGCYCSCTWPHGCQAAMCGFVIAVGGHSKLAGFAARAMFMQLQQPMCMQGKHCLRAPCSLLSAAEQHSTIWVEAVLIVVCVDLSLQVLDHV